MNQFDSTANEMPAVEETTTAEVPEAEAEQPATGRDAKVAEMLAAPPGCEEGDCGKAATYAVFNKSGRCTPMCAAHAVERLAKASRLGCAES